MSDTTIFTQFIDDVRDEQPQSSAADRPDPTPEIGDLPFGDISEIVDAVDAEQVVTKSDLNDDGTIDEISVDLDGDGIADVTISDFDNDGVVNKIDFDLDGDGEIDARAYDFDGDGTADSILYDTTGNGEFDTRHHDFDGDGVIDSINVDPSAM
ncbi:hypothetical protein ACFWGD_08335 [Corynebacterium sp. NPDC060344]|uniref:hypothetical protein n=1 Tax=Corynebacterium sp. NPDC060344 TaxID=3347101 RepID=UPI003667DA55